MTTARRIQTLAAAAALGLALLLGAGCASVSVKESNWVMEPPRLPSRIYVAPFTIRDDGMRVDRQGLDLYEFRQQFAQDFAVALAERLNKNVAPAQPGPPPPQPAPGTWVITGEFVRMNQGSRALRGLVGMGFGGTKMETITRIWQIGPGGQPVIIGGIITLGGSGAAPGAIPSGPYTGGPTLVLTASSTGLSFDARRSARMITATISEKLASMGYPLPTRPMRPKRLGSLPLL